MCFLRYDKDGCLDCIDDFLDTYADHFDLTVLTRIFKSSKTSFHTDRCYYLQRKNSSGRSRRTVLLSSGLEYIDPKLSEAELSDFRSVCGAPQSLVGQTLPDGAATVSLVSRGNESPSQS